MEVLSEHDLDAAIYGKYIAPTQRRRNKYAGIELELPIVNLEKQPVDFCVVHKLTLAFIARFSFDIISYDDSGDVYSALSGANGDSLSFDCSYNTLELSFGTETDLNVIYMRFKEYYSFICSYLKPFGYTLTGMGINPRHKINRNEPIPNGRYRMLFHHLSSYKSYGNTIPFHKYPDFGMFSCASQVQLDVEESKLADTLNTFNRLEPFKSLLFANSLWGENGNLLCSRDQFWRNSTHGLNGHNVGMYGVRFDSVLQITEYIKSMSLYCVEREEKYINFPPVPLRRYFASEQITGEYFDGAAYRKINFRPSLDDIKYLRSFKFEDLTYRGTVEFRSVCSQPIRDVMAPAAFHIGLSENLDRLKTLLDSDASVYGRGYSACELRDILNYREFPDFLDKAEVSAQLTEILDIAKDGLERRGLHEESFLNPLYSRAKYLYSPARLMADGLDSGVPLEYFINEYSKL